MADPCHLCAQEFRANVDRETHDALDCALRLRAQLTQVQAEIAALKAVVEAADLLTGRLAGKPLEYGSSLGKHNILVLEGLLAGYDLARAKLKETEKP